MWDSAGEWYPYAFAPFLQSFGGDLIDRTDFKSADTVSRRSSGVPRSCI